MKIHPQAIESLNRYHEDVKSGHRGGAEYWRGAAAAYFTANPMKIKESDYNYLSKGIYNFLDLHPEIDANSALTSTRKRWDIMWASKTPPTNQMYTYLDDNNIDTALKDILRKRISKNPLLPTLITGAALGAGATAGYLGVRALTRKKKGNPIISEIGTGIVAGAAFGTGWKTVDHFWDKFNKKNPFNMETWYRSMSLPELEKKLENLETSYQRSMDYERKAKAQSGYGSSATRYMHMQEFKKRRQEISLLKKIITKKRKEESKSNPFPTKMQSTRQIRGKKYFYAGRTQFFDKARTELQQLVERGIGGAVTKREGQYLLWTREPIWVDLAELMY